MLIIIHSTPFQLPFNTTCVVIGCAEKLFVYDLSNSWQRLRHGSSCDTQVTETPEGSVASFGSFHFLPVGCLSSAPFHLRWMKVVLWASGKGERAILHPSFVGWSTKGRVQNGLSPPDAHWTNFVHLPIMSRPVVGPLVSLVSCLLVLCIETQLKWVQVEKNAVCLKI